MKNKADKERYERWSERSIALFQMARDLRESGDSPAMLTQVEFLLEQSEKRVAVFLELQQTPSPMQKIESDWNDWLKDLIK